MNRALFTLMKLQARAAVRRSVRGVRTVRGAAFFAVGVVLFSLWLGPSLAAMVLARQAVFDQDLVRQYVPFVLLLACVGSLLAPGDKALSFTPAEVNFLFPGPFTRRQLLGYKIARAALGAAGLSLVMSVMLRPYARSWPAALVGTFVSLLFIHLFATCVALVGQAASAAAYTRGRRAVLVAIAAAAVVGVGPAILAGTAGDPATMIQRFAASTPGRILLAPFQPFARTFTAPALFPDLLGWAAAAAAADALLLALAMALDAQYLEFAAAASERVYERTQRARRGGAGPEFRLGFGGAGAGGASGRGNWLRRLKVPQPPWLCGAGPVAWRQFTTAARRSGDLLLLAATSAGLFVLFFFINRRGTDLRGALFPVMAWLTILLVATIKFDFRADLDPMPWLKSLPLRPVAVAAGQLAAPVILLAACHLAIIVAAAVVLPAMRGPLLAAAVLTLPFDVVLLAVENLLFLLFPSRGPALPSALGAMGRQAVLFFLKVATVGVAAGLAAAAGAAVVVLTHSAPAAVAAAFVVLAAEGVALVPLVALAYRRFDPSVDTPP